MSTAYPKTSLMAFRNWVRVKRRNMPGAGVNAGGFTTIVFGSGIPPPVPPVDVMPPAEPPAPGDPPDPVEVMPPLPGEPAPAIPAGFPPEFPEPDSAPPIRPVHAGRMTKAHAATSAFVPRRCKKGLFIGCSGFSEDRVPGSFPVSLYCQRYVKVV
jgi:hypothetical protein